MIKRTPPSFCPLSQACGKSVPEAKIIAYCQVGIPIIK